MDRPEEPGEGASTGSEHAAAAPARTRLGRLAGRLMPRGRFARQLLLLSSGTLAGQAIVVATSPLLTRLFTPEEFGLLTVFTAIMGFVGNGVGLRYELAVPLGESDEEAAAVVVLTSMIVLAFGAASVAALAVGAPQLARAVGEPALEPLLWLLPVAVLVWGLSLPLGYWSVRRGSFRVNAIGRVVQAGSMSTIQLGAGLGGWGGAGLIVGWVIGHAARSVQFIASLTRQDRLLLRAVRPGAVLAAARRFWRYAVFSTPSALLQSGTQFLPGVLIAALFGVAAAGWFGLAQRMLELPVRLLSNTASEVFLNAIARREPREVYRLCLRTIGRFTLLGLVGAVPLALAAPPLFALVFGEAWRAAGEVVQVLIPLQLARFVVIPISQTLYVFNRHDLHFVSAVLNIAALGASFALGWAWQLSSLTTLLLFSLGSSLAYVAYGLMALLVARRRFTAA